jgi:uncharacterized protein (TIGR03435 family)
MLKTALVGLAVAFTAVAVIGQTPPTFDVVSIRRNTSGGRISVVLDERPDGGFRVVNIPVQRLVALAYPLAVPIMGSPDWTRTEGYDVIATASLSKPTREDRIAVLRAMLADRFKLAVHIEQRERDVYDLVLARSDGRLGPGLTPIAADCAAVLAAAAQSRAKGTAPAAPPLDIDASPLPCTTRVRSADQRNPGAGDLLEGEATMDTLTNALRLGADRPIVNKTGLKGSYRVRMSFDMRAGRGGPAAVDTPPSAAATLFTAVQEDLGLKLVPAKESSDTLAVDHIERPTPD